MDERSRGDGVPSLAAVVERTFAWLAQNRRLVRDYERRRATSEAFIYVTMARLKARRLAAQ